MYRTTPRTQTLGLQRGPNGGKINLALTGFNQQNVLSIDELKKVVTGVPHAHLAGLTEISYQPIEQTLYPALSRAHLCAAEYIAETRKIVIYEATNKATLAHILTHEIGHYVFHHIINQKLRYDWTNGISPKSSFVTPYAKTNASEDFAECYAIYLLDEFVLKKIPLKHHFFKTHVFKR